MGCGGSTEGRKDDKEDGKFSHRKPKVSIRVPPDVHPRKEGPHIVFVFGGPGSKKGRIVDDLVAVYGFNLLVVEDLILRELPKKVANAISVDNTRDVADLLKEEPSHLSLEWVLEIISTEIEKDPDGLFLVDIMPNLRFLLRCEKFVKDCKYEITQFENKYPIACALNLAIPEDKVIKAVEKHTPKHPNQLKEGGQSDEADTSRTAKRTALYEMSVRTYIEFFVSTNRLVTVDVTCGIPDLIWQKVNSFFSEHLELTPQRTANTVILFGFDESAFVGLDLERYSMALVELASLVDNPDAPVETFLAALCKHVDNHTKATAECFAVDATGTTLNKSSLDQFKKRMITFLEVQDNYLDQYIVITGQKNNKNQQRARKTSFYTKKFKAVCTTDNEVCLFPMDTETDLCKQIAVSMVILRD
ncbi:uncharacterized protein LOC102807756 [Saccoglossus kowalevskii]|uniref:Uncharacterized protein LOC102807756 n=1 Tax=Saccoglossus kowalevskii TaxID=10224 RepID=A0ABM0M3Y2_SACKO|nr:PREDICTED: uncharacterized protein LOC102807756 [Saccoglossus kowalevskii]